MQDRLYSDFRLTNTAGARGNRTWNYGPWLSHSYYGAVIASQDDFDMIVKSVVMWVRRVEASLRFYRSADHRRPASSRYADLLDY